VELKGNIIFILVFIEICLCVLLHGQQEQTDIPVVSTGDIQFYIDHTSFRGLNRETAIEIYFMIYADQLKYKFQDDRETANVQMEITINNKSGTEIIDTSWTISPYLSVESTERQYQVFYDQWDHSLVPGIYNFLITVTDISSSNTGKVHFTLNVPEISQCSQFQFVSEYGSGDLKHPFYKAGRIVYPCPSRRYGIINPILFIYYELYGLRFELIDSLYIRYSVIDHDGNTTKKYQQKRIPVSNSDISISHGLSVADLESGNYELVANIDDESLSKKIRISRVFEVIQKDYLTKNFLLTKEHIKVHDDLLQILAAPEQYKYFSHLGMSAKPQYLIEFWRDKDPIPNTPENEYLIKLIERYQFANKNYSWGKIEGWDTARGHILIKYGYPDEVNQHDYEEELNPYEIWQYHDIKNYIFIFGDIRGNGRYRLLHSNAEQEIQNFNWRKRLIRTL